MTMMTYHPHHQRPDDEDDDGGGRFVGAAGGVVEQQGMRMMRMMEEAVPVVEETNNNNEDETPPQQQQQQLPPPLLLPPPQYYYNHHHNNNNNINDNNNNNSNNSGGSSSKSIKKAAAAAGLALAALCQWRIVVKAFGYATVCMLGHGHGVWSVLGLLLLYHDHERAADEDDDGEKKEASSSRPARRRMMMTEVVAGTMAGLRFTGGRFCGTLAGVLAVAWGILGACDLLLPPAWIHSLRVAPLWEAMHRVCARCQQQSSSRQQLQSQYRDLLYGALVSLLLLGLLWADMESDHKVLSEHPRDRERFPTTTHHQPHSAALLVLSRLEPGLAILLYVRSMGFVTLALLATSDSGGRYGRLLRFGGVLFAPCWTAAWTVGGLLALVVAVRAHNTNNRSSSSSSSSAGGCGEASNNNNNTTTTTWHQNTVAQGLMRQSLLLMKNNNNNTTTTTTTTTMKQQGQQQLFAQQPLLLLPPHQHHHAFYPPPHSSGSSSVAGVIDALDVNEAFRLAKAQYFGGSGRPDEEKNV